MERGEKGRVNMQRKLLGVFMALASIFLCTQSVVVADYQYEGRLLSSGGRRTTVGNYQHLSVLGEPMVHSQRISGTSSLESGFHTLMGGASFSTMTRPLFADRFNLVSLHVTPDPLGLTNVLASILGNIDFVQDADGNTLSKSGESWVNAIGDWNPQEAYLVKMMNEDVLEVEGSPIDPLAPTPLSTGFQLVPYFSTTNQNAEVAFGGILDHLDFARDEEGNSLSKRGSVWVNTIGELEPGKGYLLKMNANDTLVYP